MSEHFALRLRIQAVFLLYSLISLALSIYSLKYIASVGLHWDFIYQVLFPVSTLSCLIMCFRPRIGEGAFFLLPLFIVSSTLLVDFWIGYFFGDRTLRNTVASTSSWAFLMVSIAYVDLLESRIYHRMVNYIESQELN